MPKLGVLLGHLPSQGPEALRWAYQASQDVTGAAPVYLLFQEPLGFLKTCCTHTSTGDDAP